MNKLLKLTLLINLSLAALSNIHAANTFSFVHDIIQWPGNNKTKLFIASLALVGAYSFYSAISQQLQSTLPASSDAQFLYNTFINRITQCAKDHIDTIVAMIPELWNDPLYTLSNKDIRNAWKLDQEINLNSCIFRALKKPLITVILYTRPRFVKIKNQDGSFAIQFRGLRCSIDVIKQHPYHEVLFSTHARKETTIIFNKQYKKDQINNLLKDDFRNQALLQVLKRNQAYRLLGGLLPTE